MRIVLGKALGAPCVASYHTYFEEYLHHYVPLLPRWLGGYLARAFSRRQCAQLDGLAVPSEPMLERLDAYGIDARSVVIPTGLQPDRFAPGDAAAFRAAHAQAMRLVEFYAALIGEYRQEATPVGPPLAAESR